MTSGKQRKRSFSPWYLLLILPFIATLWPPMYAADEPRFAGMPFFYWYQFLWVVLSALLTALVYFATKRKPKA